MIKNVHGNTVDFLGEAIVAGRYAVCGDGKGTLGASIPIFLEELVGDAHLLVVGLGRKQQNGFVLRFPAESPD